VIPKGQTLDPQNA